MDREALARKCARIDKAGGSVRDFLAGLGFISPWGTWFRLQKEELGRKNYQITDGRGNEEMRKLTLADKKRAVEIAIGGGNPLKFLKAQGAGNPSASWAYIKKTLKEADPEKYEQLMEDQEAVKQKAEEEPEEGVKQVIQLTVRHEDLEEINRKAAESVLEELERAAVHKPLRYDGFDVLSVRDPGTGDTFSFEPRYGMLTWKNERGDEVSMVPEDWRKLTENLPPVMKILGI